MNGSQTSWTKGSTIRSLETIPLWIPFRTTFTISAGSRDGIAVLLVKLVTDDGVSGIGETQAWRRRGSRETIASLQAVIHDHFRERVLGRSVFEATHILRGLEEAIWDSNYAIAPIADALLDAQGKLLGVPAYQLLGGRARPHVAVGRTLGIQDDARAMADEVRQWAQEGFTNFTLKVGANPREDARRLLALRAEVGNDVTLRVDGNAGMDWVGAVEFLSRSADAVLDAAEQLLPPADLTGMADLARRFNVPMMADESVSSPEDLIRVAGNRAATAFQTKIAKNGGAWRCKTLWEIGAAAGMRIFPGNHPGTSVCTASALHLATAWAGPLLEGPLAVGVNELLATDIVSAPIRREGNRFHIDDTPGLGIELDDDAVQRLRMDKD